MADCWPRWMRMGLLAGTWVAMTHLGTAQVVDFVQEVKPLLQRVCWECHNADNDEGGFRVDDRDSVISEVAAGDASASRFYEVLVSTDETEKMPPPEHEVQLTTAEIAIFERWINQGATWPAGVAVDAPPAEPAPVPAQKDEAPPTTGSSEPQAITDAPPPVPEQVPETTDSTPATATPSPAAETAPAPVAPKSLGERAWSAAGLLHPASVHLPIGLLLAAGLFALLGLRGNFVFSDTAYYCLWVGTLGALAATALGWSAAIGKGGTGDLSELWTVDAKFFAHRLSGVIVSLGGLILALYAMRARALDPDDGFLWKLGAIALAVGVAYCGFEGGKISYGRNHYKPLYAIVEEVTGWDIDGVPNKPANPPAKKPADQENSAVGQTSAE
jgi:uncharacterized membrane protein